MNAPSKEIGFFYMVYMKGPGVYFKCWIDGSERCEFYTADEIIEFSDKLEDKNIQNKLRASFRDSSIFIWMVDEGRIERLKPEEDKSQINEKLRELMNPVKPLTSSVEISWK